MTRGFSLVELLVAVVVLSIGLLGAAGMLLGALREQSQALQRGAALSLLTDVADRVRANALAGAAYDSSSPRGESPACNVAAPCDPAALAAQDLAHFDSAAQALFGLQHWQARVIFEPAPGADAPHRYVISLQWHDERNPSGADEAALVVMAQPGAGGP